MSKENIRAIILQLNRLDVDKADYNYIISLIHKAMTQVRINVGVTKSTEFYFRARICNNEKLQKVDELRAPPTEFVKNFQRCNPPGIPMFYSASKRITALLECNVKEGDKIYLGQWMNRKPVPVNSIMSLDGCYKLPIQLTDRENSFYTYVDTIFTRPIHETFSNVYKVTSAVAEALTTKFSPDPRLDIRDDRTVGIIYPSVTNITESYNTAFHAKFAENRLDLVHVMELIVKKRDGRHLTIEVIDNAIEFPDGNIAWLNNPAAIPKPRESLDHVKFIYNGRNWVILVGEAMPTTEEINNLLYENTNGLLHNEG